ncbi:nucleotide excision repair TFIIH subunit [Syncephalis plumigaleata]|nr:nucleotide excision repair TFIIH subunit [Syncephalis plumigaleata]
MVKAIRGVLIECDSTVKQIILHINETRRFIIEDLDETHVFVDASSVSMLRAELDRILDENTYQLDVVGA